MQRRSRLKRLILFLVIVFSGFHNSAATKAELKRGDLLFQSATHSGLSKAIDEVTQTDNNKHFAHVGIVEVVNEEIFVIHADGMKGVCMEPLDSFLIDPDGEEYYVEAYRLKEEFEEIIPVAMKRAKSKIGEPYNFSYILEDEGYYCSELVWWAFKPDSIFKLSPMTFINPKTGKFHSNWIEHYETIKVEIPEGQPGCNPNGMAASDRLEFLGVVSLKVEAPQLNFNLKPSTPLASCK